jgi:hypothetical protein
MSKRYVRRASGGRNADPKALPQVPADKSRLIATFPRVSEYLGLLSSAGCDPETILVLLEWVAYSDTRLYKKYFLKMDNELEKRASALRTAIDKAGTFMIGDYLPASQMKKNLSVHFLTELATEPEQLEIFQARVHKAWNDALELWHLVEGGIRTLRSLSRLG